MNNNLHLDIQSENFSSLPETIMIEVSLIFWLSQTFSQLSNFIFPLPNLIVPVFTSVWEPRKGYSF